ncbi:unnamed protein product [Brassica napus]|uniref:(rape) hypothetical protein n=1 Tax=Brassica napus TaxID=3708 RepID=A0A816P1G8_BRANA|nr:unnamed protein product [Brassica napus]
MIKQIIWEDVYHTSPNLISPSRSFFLPLSLAIFFLPLCLRFTGDPPSLSHPSSLSHSTGSLRFTLSTRTSVQDSQLVCI